MRPIKVISKGASGPLDTQTVTVGRRGTQPLANRKAGFTTFAPTTGSISDGTSNIYGGASILQISADEVSAGVYSFFLVISGNRSNSGWTSMTINGTIFLRTGATYTFDGTNSNWVWSPGFDIWPLTGTMTPVVFN